MINLIRKLIAVPVRPVAMLMGSLRFDPLPLWSFCWNMTKNATDGCNLLILSCKKFGVENCRPLAEKMLFTSNDSQLAAAMSWLELGAKSDPAYADKWVRIADLGNFKNPEMLLHLKLFLSQYLPNYNREMILEQILSRNDLPAETTLSALVLKARLLMEKHNYEQADKIAQHILDIQEQPDARLIKWVVAYTKGNIPLAEKHFVKAQQNLPKAIFSILAAQGWLQLGEKQQAMEWLHEAQKRGYRLNEPNSPLAILANSDEFKNFSSQEQN